MSSTDATRGIPRPVRCRPQGGVLRWRREQLMAAGFDELSAHRLAADGSVDVHAMLVMRERRDDDAGPAMSRARAEASAAG